MSLILNIDTSGDLASICLTKDGKILEVLTQDNPKEHAAWLHKAIAELLKTNGYHSSNLNAIGVAIGPGSYTGLRVGLASAKGLCYALNIPLLTAGTLEMMAMAVMDEAKELICPIIDARRMEVFTAIYDKKLTEMLSPVAMIVDQNSFQEWLVQHEVLFIGSGVIKLQSVISHIHAHFSQKRVNASYLSPLTVEKYQQNRFANLAYSNPLYLKEFHYSK